MHGERSRVMVLPGRLGRSARDGCSPDGVVVLCSPAPYGLRGGAAGAATQAVDWLEVWLGDAPNPVRFVKNSTTPSTPGENPSTPSGGQQTRSSPCQTLIPFR